MVPFPSYLFSLLRLFFFLRSSLSSTPVSSSFTASLKSVISQLLPAQAFAQAHPSLSGPSASYSTFTKPSWKTAAKVTFRPGDWISLLAFNNALCTVLSLSFSISKLGTFQQRTQNFSLLSFLWIKKEREQKKPLWVPAPLCLVLPPVWLELNVLNSGLNFKGSGMNSQMSWLLSQPGTAAMVGGNVPFQP